MLPSGPYPAPTYAVDVNMFAPPSSTSSRPPPKTQSAVPPSSYTFNANPSDGSAEVLQFRKQSLVEMSNQLLPSSEYSHAGSDLVPKNPRKHSHPLVVSQYLPAPKLYSTIDSSVWGRDFPFPYLVPHYPIGRVSPRSHGFQ